MLLDPINKNLFKKIVRKIGFNKYKGLAIFCIIFVLNFTDRFPSSYFKNYERNVSKNGGDSLWIWEIICPIAFSKIDSYSLPFSVYSIFSLNKKKTRKCRKHYSNNRMKKRDKILNLLNRIVTKFRREFSNSTKYLQRLRNSDSFKNHFKEVSNVEPFISAEPNFSTNHDVLWKAVLSVINLRIWF